MISTIHNLSLINFNTLGTPFFAPYITLRYKKIAQMIRESESEIVCLQEVSTYYHVRLLKKLLPEYPYIAYQKFIFGPRGGLVILSKIPVENTLYLNYSTLGKFRNITFYTQLIKNGILVCKFKNLPLTIMNTHLVCDFTFDWAEDNHLYKYVKGQVLEAAAIFNKYRTKGESIILSGDFNMGRHSRLYKIFKASTHAIDPFQKFASSTYFTDHAPYKFKAKKSDRIDFMFLSKGKLRIDTMKVSHMFDQPMELKKGLVSYLSDHIGLRLDVKIKS